MSKQDDKLNVDGIKRKFELVTLEIFLSLIKSKDTITADDFVAACVAREVHPVYISKQVGALIKSAKANGMLLKTNTFVLSKRSSKPLPVYKCVNNGQVLKQQEC